jgi:hypothetical protein
MLWVARNHGDRILLTEARQHLPQVDHHDFMEFTGSLLDLLEQDYGCAPLAEALRAPV